MIKYILILGIIANILLNFKKKYRIWSFFNIALLFLSPLLFVTEYKPYFHILFLPMFFWLIYLFFLLVKKQKKTNEMKDEN